VSIGRNSSPAGHRSALQGTASRLQRGFTLIEIMVVVIIIGLLVAIVAPNVIGNVDKANVTKAKADIRAMKSALELYYLDNSTYPTSEQGLEALVTRPNDPNLRNWNPRGYMERIPNDPWNNPYQYLYPGNRAEFDIYSFGSDGRPGGDDLAADIGNWDL
jgi:general secretion pathway protein G